MAFFKFRKTGDDAPSGPSQPESVEVLRRRARHRLIGAAVLVLIGVVGFPLLFDTQPRPVPVDIPIDIPDRNKAKPLVVQPAAPTAPNVSAAPAAPPLAPASVASTPSGKVSATEALGPREEVIVPAKPENKAEAKPESKPEPRAESKPVAKGDDGDRAKALLEGKQPAPAAAEPSEARYIVQVGAFADMAKAKEAQRKLEKAGLKNYIQSVDTKDGKRNRVRAGPFGSKAEADKAAEKIKTLDLPASILTL